MTDVMSALDEKIIRMKANIVELLDGLDEMKDRPDEVESSLLVEMMNVVRGSMVPLIEKDKFLEAELKGLKMKVRELKREKFHEASVEALKLEVQELKIELALCKASIMNGMGFFQAAPKVDVPNPRSLGATGPPRTWTRLSPWPSPL